MKTWQLVLVQLWVLCFVPVWIFILIFAPLVLAPPNPSRVTFLLFGAPPLIAVVGCVALWIARWRSNVRWQKIMAIVLILFPVVATLPLFIWK